MPTLSPELTSWSVVFAPLFSKRVWSSVQVLLTGAILAIGARTVTAVLRVIGLAHEKQFWRTVTLAHWYGQGNRSVQVATGTAIWYSHGMPAVPLRWVLVRDPKGQFQPRAFLCTDQSMTPAQILGWFVQRWQTEVTFEEARAHLGKETQRQWSKAAIARTTPVILALYSMVTLLAKPLFEQGTIPIRSATWYHKQCATFSDTMALVRRYLWREQTLSMWEHSTDTIEIPRDLFQRLADTLSYAA